MESKINKIIEIFDKHYADAKCALNYSSQLELLVCARLSAQCTDLRVNLVTPRLFSRFKTVDDFANADIIELQEYIKTCGLYKTKSRHIIDMCKMLIEKFNRSVPTTLEDLQSLPGIGRKTANLFLAEIYKKPVIVVDTHFARITRRLGFHDSRDPFKIEIIMKDIVPEDKAIKFGHQVIAHGRKVCIAKFPSCEKCCLKNLCNSFGADKIYN